MSAIPFYLGLKHFPLLPSKDLLTAGPLSHPASGAIVTTTITTTTPLWSLHQEIRGVSRYAVFENDFRHISHRK
jgi:hypothetical protein